MITTILTPDLLPDSSNAQVVILDVLRATSTIATTLAAGAREVRLFDSLDAARTARAQFPKAAGPVLLAGESQCLRPPDFDLGNSPREHVTEKVGNATILLATTNGTRAAARARDAGAKTIFAASLLNATATADALIPHLDTTHTILLCAGTNGQIAQEDVIGAGAV